MNLQIILSNNIVPDSVVDSRHNKKQDTDAESMSQRSQAFNAVTSWRRVLGSCHVLAKEENNLSEEEFVRP